MTNELGDEIPADIEAEATHLACAQGVRYVYIDNEYGEEYPAASIGLSRAKRFGSTSYGRCKHVLGEVGVLYVAFHSPSKLKRTPIPHVRDDQVPELPDARIGEETNTYAIDDTPLNFKVLKGFVWQLPHNRIKAYCVQLLQVDDGDNYARSHLEVRIAYYMVVHKGRRRGKWAFGQFAPMMTLDEYREINRRIEAEGWFTEPSPPAPPADA